MAMSKHKTEHSIKLTAAEIANLWTSYMNDTLAVCTIGRFLEHIEDREIEAVLKTAYSLSKAHVVKLKAFFNEEKITTPIGLTENVDVYLDAPRLFTDNF